MTYEEAQSYIASLEPRGWRLGLDRMWELARRCGLPGSLGEPGGPQYIHVAGTNGKGSVTAFLQSILVESGYRTGAFFSPYVYDPRERIQFGRSLIEKEALAELTEEMAPIADGLSGTAFEGVTEFEFKTALGFLYWKRRMCDWVALEVGLGGRLDATNIVDPSASVVVSIGLDHTTILGTTHAAIAAEKAGVIKPGKPVIVGEMVPEAKEVILDAANRLNAPVWLYGREIEAEASASGIAVRTPRGTYRNLRSGVPGAMQPHNLALAVAAVEASGAFCSREAVARGASSAWAPGRFQRLEVLGRHFLMDGAHNAESSQILRRTLTKEYPGERFTLLTGMVAGHDALNFYQPLLDLVDKVHVVPIDFHRSQDPNLIASALSQQHPAVCAHGSAEKGLAAALKSENKIVVAGSFYLVGEIGRLLKVT